MAWEETLTGIVGIVIIFGLFLIEFKYGILGLKDRFEALSVKIDVAILRTTGLGGCTGFFEASEKWIGVGLGLPGTFRDSDIVTAAENCGVVECIRPAGFEDTRISTRDCLKTAITVVNIAKSVCVLDYDELGYKTPKECTDQELKSILPGMPYVPGGT